MTSLTEQLKRLAVPQTSNLVDTKVRPSILFDPKEAATKDRKLIYEIGCEGLGQLILLNHEFAQFERTLFEQTSINLQRSMEDSAFNKELDKNIQKFFYHLSPYFMLRPAHMCLEWLIRRFSVHQYNKSAFVCLILPYHETNIFVKCVQILKLNDPTDEWHFLRAIQKPGVHLPKNAIFNRAATNQGFLAIVCKNIVDAMKELGTRGRTLQSLLNFYCSTVLGAFEHVGTLREWHITTVLPSVLKGLSSTSEDFVSASFVIISQLVAKTTVTEKLLDTLVSRICKVKHEKLQTSVILALNWMAKTHSNMFTQFNDKDLVDFIGNKWLIGSIRTLINENVSIDDFLKPVIRTAIKLAQEESESSNGCRFFIENLLYEIKLPTLTSKMVISSVLKSFTPEKTKQKTNVKAENHEGVIDLSSDEETNDNQVGLKEWYSKILRLLESQYPEEFDQIVKEILQSGDDDVSQKLTAALAFRFTFLDEKNSMMFQNLYHVNPTIRALAVKELVQRINRNKNTEDNYNLLKQTLADRIKDDSAKVVKELLQLSTYVFIEIVGHESFADFLFDTLERGSLHPQTWGSLQTVALDHLLSTPVVDKYDNNLILISLLRYLFPSKGNNNSDTYIRIILQSPFAKRNPYLREFMGMVTDEQPNVFDFQKAVFAKMATSGIGPSTEDLIKSLESCGKEFLKDGIQVSHFLAVTTICLKANSDPETVEYILDFILKQCNRFRIRFINDILPNEISLQLLRYFIFRLIRCTNLGNLLDWQSPINSLRFFLNVFGFVAAKAFGMDLKVEEKREWSLCLRDMMNSALEKTNDKIEFLSQFLLYEQLEKVKNFSELRIRSLRLLQSIIRGDKGDFNPELRLLLKVLTAMNSPLSVVRECAFNIMTELEAKTWRIDAKHLIHQVLARKGEILCDAEQIPLIVYNIFSKKTKKIISLEKLLDDIMIILKDPSENSVFKAKILETIKHIKTPEILHAVIPFAIATLDNVKQEKTISYLDKISTRIFKLVVMQFDEKTIREVISTDDLAWQLIAKSLSMAKTFATEFNEKPVPVPCITLQIFEEEIYNQLPSLYKTKMLHLIVEVLTSSASDALALQVNKAIKSCKIDCGHILPVLEQMKNVCTTKQQQKRKSGQVTTNVNWATSKQWQEGVTLLELIESKKKLENTHLLIPILFEILSKCLDTDNQSPLEYTKQLILSALLQNCQRLDSDKMMDDISENTFRIDLIVQCIRRTQNPQTHYNALLLLSHCAGMFPQQVLHNIVDIFTFMGSSIARHDDAFSFQIIANIVDSIIPIVVQERAADAGAPASRQVVAVLKIFSDILLDVPEHRRIPLYSKLMQTLGVEQYFWVFLCVVFESQVLVEEKITKKINERPDISSSLPSLPKRIEVVLQLLQEFHPNIALQTCISLMEYVRNLPLHNEDSNPNLQSKRISLDRAYSSDFTLFDITTRTAKQLRHYRYLIVQFVSNFTSSTPFLTDISTMDEFENKSTKQLYQNFILKTLSYIPEITAVSDKCADPGQVKFWKVILHHCFDALDNIISLLTPDMFLVVLHGLMQHKLVMIRKKMIELLIAKQQEKEDFFVNCKDENVLNIIQILQETVGTITVTQGSGTLPTSNETLFVQQAALIAIKLLAKIFAMKHIEQFRELVVVLTGITKKRAHISKVVFATVILALVEVTAHLKVHAVAQLPKFMPHLVDALQDQATILQKQPPDNVSIALITGIQKLFETMPLFLGPYIVGILSSLSIIWTQVERIHTDQDQKKAANIFKHMNLMRTKITADVPARILIPNCEKAYYALFEAGNFSSVRFLMKILSGCVENSTGADLSTLQAELSEFFLKLLELRSEAANQTPEQIAHIEADVIDAFVAWILKLPESSFRPVYQKIYDWALREDGPKNRVLTFFILTKSISESIKSLFVPYASDFLNGAAELLSSCNTSKTKELYFPESKKLNQDLLRNILVTLTNIFLHDAKGFINPQRFDIIAQPIVDQLDNQMIQPSEELRSVLSACISQLAVAVSNDVLWKQLNYQILMKTRTNSPEIRINAFSCCVDLAKKLGESYTTLLPETIPFIAELFEDENPDVVQSARKAVQDLEEVVGESLQKYL